MSFQLEKYPKMSFIKSTKTVGWTREQKAAAEDAAT